MLRTITMHAVMALGQTPDDVVAEALLTQHERAAVESIDYRDVAPDLLLIVMKYHDGGGEAEVQDAAHRLLKTKCAGVDSLRITPRKA